MLMCESRIIVDQKTNHGQVPGNHLGVLSRESLELNTNTHVQILRSDLGGHQRRFLGWLIPVDAFLPLWAFGVGTLSSTDWALRLRFTRS